jgi:hypothetical protein
VSNTVNSVSYKSNTKLALAIRLIGRESRENREVMVVEKGTFTAPKGEAEAPLVILAAAVSCWSFERFEFDKFDFGLLLASVLFPRSSPCNLTDQTVFSAGLTLKLSKINGYEIRSYIVYCVYKTTSQMIPTDLFTNTDTYGEMNNW